MTSKRVKISLFCLFLLGIANCAQSQTISPKDFLKFEMKASISASTSSLETILDQLSKITGLRIECESYLRQRTITVVNDGMKIKEILDAVCELNDWKWIRTKQGSYLISKRYINRPQNMVELSKALRSAMPNDFRDFIGIGSVNRFASKEKLSPFESAVFDADGKAHLEIGRVVKAEGKTLFEAIQRFTSKPEKIITYNNLSAEERDRLCLILVLKALEDSNLLMLKGEFTEYAKNPLSASLRFNQGLLWIGTAPTDADHGFIGVGLQMVHLDAKRTPEDYYQEFVQIANTFHGLGNP